MERTAEPYNSIIKFRLFIADRTKVMFITLTYKRVFAIIFKNNSDMTLPKILL